MQEAKKKPNRENEDSKKKERHIVTWTPQEDDILRQQINLHGTENWSIIASKFTDKTTRQCRRRWYTYLNSDFKKGGWSPEEDILLCEAQRIFGNRWTEIAKVVSGRTDNAVKNRFSTLCKKRAKYEALVKENKSTFVNQNNKRFMLNNGFDNFDNDVMQENAAPAKKLRRSHIPDNTESYNRRDRSHPQYRNHQPRPPFAVLAQNFHIVNMAAQHHVNIPKEVCIDSQNSKIQGSFLKKDDPRITALMQQAELLSTLALKVSVENTDHSLENAWKVLQDYLNRSKETDSPRHGISDIDFQLEDFKDLMEDLRSSNDGSQPLWRQPDLQEESQASSEYSTGSTLMSYTAPDKTEKTQTEVSALDKDIGDELQSILIDEQNVGVECEKSTIFSANVSQVEILPSCNEETNDIVVAASSSTEFSSPLHVTPMFRSLAAAIPSPKFSESERHFLLKTLGMESPCANLSINPSEPPPCKRALLQSL
uniref:MYB family protein n=1 Tax=Rhizophora mucronata TaxID=61149 RepID=A0A2P2JZC8_RHIMU